MPEKFKKGFKRKLDKTAKSIKKRAKNLKPSIKVSFLYNMFKRLHLGGKMWQIDNDYWKNNIPKL